MIVFEFQGDSSDGIMEKRLHQSKSLCLVKYFSNLFSPCIPNHLLSFIRNHFSSRLVLAVRTRTRLHIGEIFNEQNNRHRPYLLVRMREQMSQGYSSGFLLVIGLLRSFNSRNLGKILGCVCKKGNGLNFGHV